MSKECLKKNEGGIPHFDVNTPKPMAKQKPPISIDILESKWDFITNSIQNKMSYMQFLLIKYMEASSEETRTKEESERFAMIKAKMDAIQYALHVEADPDEWPWWEEK